jgi:GntR family transcriptional regulator, rspAB operon transcriptional repressor
MADAALLRPLTAKPDTLSTLVYDSIRSAIVDKQLAPGERLSEAKLAAQLQVSKTPVREALLRLQTIGLAVADGVLGLSVVSPSRDNVGHAYEVRQALEALAAQMCAERATDEQRDRIYDAAASSLSCAEAANPADRLKWDRTFHALIAEAAGNPRLATLIEDHYSLTWALRQRDIPQVSDGIDCARQHIQVADAIRANDAAGAAVAMGAHIELLRSLVLSALSEDATS